jgi:hypothetical protein
VLGSLPVHSRPHESRTVVDPFCGHGTVLAIANELGMDAIGVERGGKRARRARELQSSGFRLQVNADEHDGSNAMEGNGPTLDAESIAPRGCLTRASH